MVRRWRPQLLGNLALGNMRSLPRNHPFRAQMPFRDSNYPGLIPSARALSKKSDKRPVISDHWILRSIFRRLTVRFLPAGIRFHVSFRAWYWRVVASKDRCRCQFREWNNAWQLLVQRTRSIFEEFPVTLTEMSSFCNQIWSKIILISSNSTIPKMEFRAEFIIHSYFKTASSNTLNITVLIYNILKLYLKQSQIQRINEYQSWFDKKTSIWMQNLSFYLVQRFFTINHSNFIHSKK